MATAKLEHERELDSERAENVKGGKGGETDLLRRH